MIALLRLAAASAWNRRVTLLLMLSALSLSVAMLLGVERARLAARQGFERSIAGTDLIVGARSHPVQLLLHAVFRLGEGSQTMSWRSVEAVSALPAVAWTVPLSLGDSHRGYPVLGTIPAYFDRYRYGLDQALALRSGRRFDGLFEAVLGAEVAARLGYGLGERIALSHGSGLDAQAQHEDLPFEVVGVLARTGTPVDRSIHVGLQSLEAIHLGWQAGAPLPGLSIPAGFVRKFDLSPKAVSALLVGLEQRSAVFQVQRAIAQREGEALMAVLPGVALDQLWTLVGTVEQVLQAVSALVVALGLGSLVAIVWAGLGERRRELAILRSVGAGPLQIAALLALEGLLLALAGALLGWLLLGALTLVAAPWIQSGFGIELPAHAALGRELALLAGVVLAGLVASLLPAWRASRLALADGLTPRL